MKKILIKGFVAALVVQGLWVASVIAQEMTCTKCTKYGDVWYCESCVR